MSADLWHDIEENYDYLYAEYSTDGGATGPRSAAVTGVAARKWATQEVDLQAGRRSGEPVPLPLRHRRRLQPGRGFIDDISIKTGKTYASPTAPRAATTAGRPTAGRSRPAPRSPTRERYYLLENRQYVGYDDTLQVGPYQFSEAYTRPDWVERFPYQNGMLVWFVDQGYADNNTIDHPGAGYALPVDARPDTLTYPTAPARATGASRSTRSSARTSSTRSACTKQVAVKAKGKTTISPSRRATRGAPGRRCRRSTTPTRWPTTRPPTR